MKTRIHVNKSIVSQNARQGTNRPAITAKNYRSNQYGHRVDIVDNDGNVVASVVQSEKPLSCGARVWVETDLDVRVSVERRPKRNSRLLEALGEHCHLN